MRAPRFLLLVLAISAAAIWDPPTAVLAADPVGPFPDSIAQLLPELLILAGCSASAGGKVSPGEGEVDVCQILKEWSSAKTPLLEPFQGAVYIGRSGHLLEGRIEHECSRILIKGMGLAPRPAMTFGEGSAHSRELLDLMESASTPPIPPSAWRSIAVHVSSLTPSDAEEKKALKAYLDAARKGMPPPHNALWEYFRKEALEDSRTSQVFATTGKSLGAFSYQGVNVVLFRQLGRRLLYVELPTRPRVVQGIYVGEFFLKVTAVPTEGKSMNDFENNSKRLQSALTKHQWQKAGKTAELLGDQTGLALLPLADHPDDGVRERVLELACEHPSLQSSRIILSRLQDPNLGIRSLAYGRISWLGPKDILRDLLVAIKKPLDPDAKGELVLRIGILGDATVMPALEETLAAAEDADLIHDIELAMARLGDARMREIVLRGLDEDDVNGRLFALQNAEYLGDHQLVARLGKALADERDAIDLTPRHGPNLGFARVCDRAVAAMGNLGVPLSFKFSPLTRLTDAQLAEARQIQRTFILGS